MAYAKIVLDATQKVELEEMADSERDQDLALRARIVLMLAEGMRVVDIAKKLGVNKDAVTRWKRRWLEGGADALRSRHGGGRAPVGDTNGLASRIRGLIDSNPDAAWKRAELAAELGVSVSKLNRELKAMGATLERATSWEIPADTGVASRSACLAGLFLSPRGRCVVAFTSGGPLEPVGGSVLTRGRLLAAELEGAGDGLDLSDALWTAADHASDPGKVRPQTLRQFVERAVSATPDGASCHAIALDDGTLSWSGRMPRGLSVEEASDAADWEARAASLVARLAGPEGRTCANALTGAVGAFCGACGPTTDPFAWVRGVRPRGDAVGIVGGTDNAVGADGSGAPRFASVEEALSSVVGGATDGREMDCKMIVVVRGPEGVDFGVVDGPVAFPGVDDFSFGSTEGLAAGIDRMEAPMMALRNEAGKAAAEMFVSSAKKNSIGEA